MIAKLPVKSFGYLTGGAITIATEICCGVEDCSRIRSKYFAMNEGANIKTRDIEKLLEHIRRHPNMSKSLVSEYIDLILKMYDSMS